jgi:rod shape-determining protein MreD
MTRSVNTFVRCGILLLLAVVLQVSNFSQLNFLGGNADITVLVVAAIGLYAGSVPGAIAGFVVGMLLDLALGANLGATSLILTVIGYFVGRFMELRDPAHGLIPLPVALAASFGYVVGVAAVQFMLEIGASVSVLAVREMITTILLNVILAMPVFALVRRIVRPVLLYDPLERRRRRAAPQATGPIGLRGLDVKRTQLP